MLPTAGTGGTPPVSRNDNFQLHLHLLHSHNKCAGCNTDDDNDDDDDDDDHDDDDDDDDHDDDDDDDAAAGGSSDGGRTHRSVSRSISTFALLLSADPSPRDRVFQCWNNTAMETF